MKFGMEIGHILTYMICCFKLPVTNMATVRIFEVMSDKFEIVLTL
jgi:hypothetical protein